MKLETIVKDRLKDRIPGYTRLPKRVKEELINEYIEMMNFIFKNVRSEMLNIMEQQPDNFGDLVNQNINLKEILLYETY